MFVMIFHDLIGNTSFCQAHELSVELPHHDAVVLEKECHVICNDRIFKSREFNFPFFLVVKNAINCRRDNDRPLRSIRQKILDKRWIMNFIRSNELRVDTTK